MMVTTNQMYEALDNMDDYALMAGIKPVGPHRILTVGIEELEQLRARVVELEQSLSRIVSYYDIAKRGPSFPSMTDQAMAEHESTMFGEARKVLKNGR